MPLYIKDDAVDKLAAQVQEATGAPSKTEAVRRALENELARSRKSKPLGERLARAKLIAADIGEPDPAFDMKAFTNEMWGV
ncbi:type II toxin-antitoxin system VapB family antitoxin [Methylosinus sp. H3A]|uniref:type II toxin-antitoxin system VapB family antitoxin n=1 Tax=Methylosinus sp. H3A TaxID=2785786 RepID=UPI0018C25AC0|nr:type II toxin-antitoxin system VapB family antitoxin [Methylosinus sp. H3A]MBG0812320.1 type II toxin-antitoxin system VapB family antitoxin [Methylosinus sp. H3A]